MSLEKIVDLNGLAVESANLKKQGKSIVLCHGTFDLIHNGHIRYLKKAIKEGDILFVTVTADAYVNKGPGRPVFNENLRAENLAALECVSHVAISNAISAVEAINLIAPDFYVKGSEYIDHTKDITGNIKLEQDAVEKNGGRVVYTNELTFSSSNLLNKYYDLFPARTKEFLQDFKQTADEEELTTIVSSLSNLKVLVVGDAIIDQYHYTSILGQTGKGNALAVRHESEEEFTGGSIAVAKHIAGFVNSVTLLTGLGSVDSHESFIRQNIPNNVTPIFHYFKDAPTVTKRRFVDSDLAKLFEVYYAKDEPIIDGGDEGICKWLRINLSEYDMVVVPDFGNGFISPPIIHELIEGAKFLAVNTQINSGNRGFHVINQYIKADFVSLNEPELRLAAHNRRDPLRVIVKQMCEKLNISQLAVTMGTKGVLMYDKKSNSFFEIPALSTNVVDRIGAGDAFLSITALLAAKKIDFKYSAFIGSVAAAMDVQIVCNREPVDPVVLIKYIKTLLK